VGERVEVPANRHSVCAFLTAACTVAFLVLAAVVAVSASAAEKPVLLTSFGPDGTSGSSFASTGSLAFDQQSHVLYVVVPTEGKVLKFGPQGEPLDFGGTGANISGNELSGFSLYPGIQETQIAVDSTTHVFYLTTRSGVQAFEANGEPAEFTGGAYAGSNELGGFSEVIGVAVDQNGDIYASDYAGTVSIYAASGETITSFSAPEPAQFAVGADGTLYVGQYNQRFTKYSPSPFPVISSTIYTPASSPIGSAPASAAAVDGATGTLYVAEEGSSPQIAEYENGETLVATFGGSGEAGEINFVPGIAFAENTPIVYVANNAAAGNQVELFGTAPPPPPGPPTISATFSYHITASSADLGGEVTPHTLATSYYFEYGTTACSAVPDPCARVPLGEESVGDGVVPVRVSQHLSGLASATQYHYRLVATNSMGIAVGDERSFTTQVTGPGFRLPDGRQWELVSPAAKPGGGAIVPPSIGGLTMASEGGDAITFLTSSPIEGEPSGNRSPDRSVSLARWTGSGWQSQDITPPHETAAAVSIGSEYRIFSSDLARAAVEPHAPYPLSEEASEHTPYLRQNFGEQPTWRPLVTGKEGFANVPPGTQFGGEPGEQFRTSEPQVKVAGGSPDLRHVIVWSKIPLSAETAGLSESLYEWEEGNLHPIDILPADEGGSAVQAALGSAGLTESGTIDHAVSNDGSYVFWTGRLHAGLYVRDVPGAVTARLDVAQFGATGVGAEKPVFQGATPDGRHVFFTDTQQLTPDAGEAGADLYECEIAQEEAGPVCHLRNLTATSGASAEVQGMVPAIGEGGDTLYFVANGELAPGSEAGSCKESTSTVAEQRCNLYVAHRAGTEWTTRFVAQLSGLEASDWGGSESPGAAKLTADGSPSGRYLAFMSSLPLTGYDNLDAVTGEPDQEVFVYDEVLNELTCVSCNVTGARPSGVLAPPTIAPVYDWRGRWFGKPVAAVLPDPEIPDQYGIFSPYRPRAVLDNGRVFFNARGELVPADTNQTWDAYQYEPRAVGDCEGAATSASVVPLADGCVALLSSGSSSSESGVLDASVTGDHVFILTAARLSPPDIDNAYDIYDVHVCGSGWPCPTALEEPTDCEGTACRTGVTAETPATPASALVNGHGNMRRRHRRRHHRKHHHARKRNHVKHRHRHDHSHQARGVS
jgi:hypothetical protein